MDEVVLNDEAVMNDYGFYVLNSGLDLTRFKLNPVVIVNHDKDSLPIGRVDISTLRVEGTRLISKIVWDEEDTDETTKRLIAKYKSGFMRGFSMGLMVFKMADTGSVETPQYYAVKSELYELSAVTLPSNSGSVVLVNKPNTLVELKKGAQLLTLGFDKDGKILFDNKLEVSDMKKIIEKLGLPENTTEYGLVAYLSTMLSKLAAAEKHNVEAALASGRANGVVTDANEPNFRLMLQSNFDATNAILATVPATQAAAPLKVVGNDAPATLTALLSAFGKQTPPNDPNDCANWTMTDWQKKDSVGLAQLKSQKPVEYDTLLKAHRLANGF